MRQPSKDTIDYYIFPNKILCHGLGMWPSDKKRSAIKRILMSLYFVIALLLVLTIMVPEVILVVDKWNDLKTLAGAGCLIMSLVQVLFKMVYLTAKRERAHRLYKELRSLWNLTDDPVERQSFEVFAYWARTCTITFAFSCLGTITTFAISATYDYIKDDNIDAANSSRHLPYDVRRGIDFISSPEFEIIFVCQILGSVVCCFAVSGLDGACMTIVLHLSGQFRLVAKWLSKIEMKCNRINMRNCPSNVTTDLTRCVRHHQRLINVVNDVNSLWTPIIFLQVLTSSIVFCLGGYAIISNDNADDLCRFVSFIVSMTIQLVVWCWPGEILVQESLDVGYSIYVNVPWYRLPPFYRRQLCLVVQRSQRYCSISAIFFHSLSIDTLTNVLKTAFSYFALLRQIQDETT